MMQVQAGAGAPDYPLCRYGTSRAVFRGPPRDLSRPYVAFLGGTATLAKSVASPFVDLVEHGTGLTCVNLGALNAGPDFYLSDPGALEVAGGAELAVVQLPGAETLTNPFYAVHPRRNDRVLCATPALRRLYPEVDFADIHFARHLLTVLSWIDANRFVLVRQALQRTWLARMQDLLGHLPQRRLLFRVEDSLPADDSPGGALGAAPLFVDGWMVAALQASGADLVVATPAAIPGRLAEAVPGRAVPTADLHQRSAAVLAPRITGILAGRPAPLVLLPSLAIV
jgi:hypothetical protein